MLYEDDFEFEEQPADVRDRPIPGKSGAEETAEAPAGGATPS